MNEENATLKQYQFLHKKGKWVEGMTKAEAHAIISEMIPKKEEPTADFQPDYEFHGNVNSPTEKPKKSYNLTEENIRIGALDCTINYFSPNNKFNEEIFWNKVKEFEEYIRDGS